MLPTLLGLGDAGLDIEVDGFLHRTPSPTGVDVAAFLKLYSGERRNEAARALVTKGVSADIVNSALSYIQVGSWFNSNAGRVWGVLALASGAASAFHGYRRNQSIGWGMAWFMLGTWFPIITPAIALAQGFGQRKAG